MIKKLYLLSLILVSIPLFSQIIFTESIANTIDSTRTVQGTIAPELNFKTEKENFFNFKNNANINFLLNKKKYITIINQMEFSTYGKKLNVSSGYIHTEYRYLVRPAIELYPFAEAVWAPSRGLKIRTAGGLQSRYRIFRTSKVTLSTGIGLFYEYEKWNYNGVPNPDPQDMDKIEQQRSIKGQVFASFKFNFGEKWNIITSGYTHFRPDSNIKNLRIAYSIDVKHSVTKHFGIWLSYQNTILTKPIVPIRKHYTVLTGGVFISF